MNDQNPKDLVGNRKVPLHLFPPAGVIYGALGMWDGSKKYGPYNWRQKKVIASIYIDAALRHIQAYLDGENIDPDSKSPTLGHAIACLAILADATETGNLIDDRPIAGKARELLARWQRSVEEDERRLVTDQDNGPNFMRVERIHVDDARKE